ncbi:MAG: ATP-binding protein [Candidatus Bathyarchaeia archaeon]
MLREDVERFNEWWFTGSVRRELAPPFKRHVFSGLLETFKERQILLIVGPRRVGKTTLMYQAIEQLLTEVDPLHVLYYSFDESPVNVRDILDFYERRVLAKPFEQADRVFIFLDEIQYASNWPSTVKQFYDLYPNIKFFISGSSTLLLSREAAEKLAGRFFTLKVKPLTFTEFLQLKGVAGRMELSPRRAEAYFHEYLKKAGFPEIVNWESDRRIAEYIRNSVIDRVVLRDIPALFRTRNMVLMENIVRIILSNPGSLININALSQSLGENKITILNYLKYLELSMLIRTLSNFRPSQLAASRKLKKYYPISTSLTFAVLNQGFRAKIGSMLETYAVNALDAEYYYRSAGKEIDIILKNDKPLPIEVKESVSDRDIADFSKLIKRINPEKGVIISLNQETKKNNIEVIPAYALEQQISRLKQN